MCVGGRTAWCMQVVEVGRKQGLGQWKVHRHEEDLLDVFPRESIVYLSPDATDVLEVRSSGTRPVDWAVAVTKESVGGCAGCGVAGDRPHQGLCHRRDRW